MLKVSNIPLSYLSHLREAHTGGNNTNIIDHTGKDPTVNSVLDLVEDCSIIEVRNPYSNRKVLKNACKGLKGIYIWKILNNTDMYIGYSINLYNRIVTYFSPYNLN